MREQHGSPARTLLRLAKYFIAIALITFTMLGGQLFAQAASFSGSVLTDPGEKPLANAEILLKDLKRSVRSDSAGNFLFTGLPAGRMNVTVRLVGYEPFSAIITLSPTQRVEADILLKEASTKLDSVKVTATAKGPYAARLAEFEERRALSAGRFMTADEFEAENGRPMSAFLTQKIPGLRVVQSGGRHWLSTSSRGINARSGSPSSIDKIPLGCYVQVIVNGIVRYDGSQPMFDIDDEINSANVIGFEFYTTANTPIQYNKTRGTSGCGTVIIWTK